MDCHNENVYAHQGWSLSVGELLKLYSTPTLTLLQPFPTPEELTLNKT